MAQHCTCAVHASRRGGQVPGYVELPRPGSQALSQPTPSLPPSPPPPACWVLALVAISLLCAVPVLHQPPKPPPFRRLPQHTGTMTMDGWAQRFLTAPCVLRAPWAVARVGHSVCSPASCNQRCSPGAMGPSFMHCTCHELTLRQPAPKPAQWNGIRVCSAHHGPHSHRCLKIGDSLPAVL